MSDLKDIYAKLHPYPKPVTTPGRTEAEIIKIGCIVCRRQGVYTHPEIHHVRKLATSKKRKRAPKIGLCYMHHSPFGEYGVALHAGEKEFEKNFGSVLGMLEEVNSIKL